jgi:hypothetical protein
VVTLCASGVAAAQPSTSVPDAPAEPATARPRWQFAATLDLRVTRLDSAADRFTDDAMAYGWRVAAARPLLGGRWELHYLHAPIVDVGVSGSYGAMSFAAGIDPDDRMATSWYGLAASARLHWAGGRPFVPEPRVDVGVAAVDTTVHTTTAREHRGFTRVGADWRLGVPNGGVNLAVGFTWVGPAATDGPSPPLGGLDLALGPYFRF